MPLFIPYIGGPYCRRMEGRRGAAKLQLELYRKFSNSHKNYDGNAYTLVATYLSDCGLLQLYTMHPTSPDSPTSRPKYHLVFIGSFSLIQSLEVLSEGLRWFRNSRDLAKEFRDDVIMRVNGIANASSKGAADQESTTTQNAASDISKKTSQ